MAAQQIEVYHVNGMAKESIYMTALRQQPGGRLCLAVISATFGARLVLRKDEVNCSASNNVHVRVCVCAWQSVQRVSLSLARHEGGGGGSPIFNCKSSLEDIRGSHLDLCQALRVASCEMQIPPGPHPLASELCQLQMTAGVTNKVWIPVSCRCVCNV